MATNNGAIVVATQDWHPPSRRRISRRMAASGRSIASPGTWGAELHPDLALPDDAPRVRKGVNGEDGYSGFTMRDPRRPARRSTTELEGLLREAGVERVVVVGLATDYCVKATALDARSARLRDGRPGRRDRGGRPQARRRRAGARRACATAGVGIVADGDAVIRGAVRLALVGAGIGYALDRVLAEQSQGRASPSRSSSLIVIDAPIERVWDVLADIEGQPRWMNEMKAVRS